MLTHHFLVNNTQQFDIHSCLQNVHERFAFALVAAVSTLLHTGVAFKIVLLRTNFIIIKNNTAEINKKKLLFIESIYKCSINKILVNRYAYNKQLIHSVALKVFFCLLIFL